MHMQIIQLLVLKFESMTVIVTSVSIENRNL